MNSTIAQLLARGSILIPPLGITVQLGQHELTILMQKRQTLLQKLRNPRLKVPALVYPRDHVQQWREMG